MKKSSVYGILASFLAFVSLAACCELILRLTGYGDAQNIVTSDPYLGYRLSPGTHAKLLGVEVGVSKQGFRDRLHDIQKEPGRERFVFVGDSQTLGHGVRPEEAFPQRVADSAGVETINMGCPGWGPDQYLLFLEHYGLEYRPDVAVMAVSIGSDLSDLLDPLDDKFIVDKFSTLMSNIRDIGEGRRKGSVLRQFKSFFRYRSKLYSFCVDRFKIARANARNRSSKKAAGAAMPFVYQVFAVSKNIATPEADVAYGRLEKIFSDFQSLCVARSIKPCVLLIPSKMQSDEGRFDGGLKMLDADRKDFDPALPGRRLAEYCRSKNLLCLDAYQTIRARYKAAGKGGVYFEKDEHLSPGGHQLLAQAVADWLRSQNP